MRSCILVSGYTRHRCVKWPPPREGFNYYLLQNMVIIFKGLKLIISVIQKVAHYYHDKRCVVLTYSDNTRRRIKSFWCGGESMAESLRFAVGPFPLLSPSLLSLWLWLLMVVGRAWHVQLIPLNERGCPYRCGAKWAFTNALHPAWGKRKVC